jgi:hypothetical protein
MYDKYQVNINGEVRDNGLTLTQIIEAGLEAYGQSHDEHTFYVYPMGSE